jgi:hypothetical protein
MEVAEAMLGFIEFLEEIERNRQTVVIDGAHVECLVRRFGPRVRSMGVWNKTADGSVEVPMANIIAAAQRLGDESLREALEQLKTPGELTGILTRFSAAEQLIEELAQIHLQQFQCMAERFQEADDPTEIADLRRQISVELFGS